MPTPITDAKKKSGRVAVSVAFIFPGQGSQAIGMGKALYDAFPASRAVFDEVDAALGEKLSTLMFEGDPEAIAADRQRPAGADGGQPRRACARLKPRRASTLARDAAFRRRPFARRIFGARRRRRAENRRRRAAVAPARARPCRRPCRWARAPWRRCSAPNRNWRRRSPAKPPPPPARCAKSPTTMAAARSSSPAPGRRSNSRSRSPRTTESSAPCCCRSPRPSIAR